MDSEHGFSAQFPPSQLRRLPDAPLGIELWLADLDQALGETGAWLSADELQRAARFVFERDRRRYLASHCLLRRLLAETHGTAPGRPFRIGPHGKPYLPSPQPGCFNMSHSDRWALFGFGSGGEVGVDLEHVRPVEDFFELAEHNFSMSERDELNRAVERGQEAGWRAFLHGWTRKEACVKALGVGLSIEPGRFHVGLAPLNSVTQIDVGGTIVDLEVASVSADLGQSLIAAVARVRGGSVPASSTISR